MAAQMVPANISYDSLVKTGVIPSSQRSSIQAAFDRLRNSGDKAELHAVEAVKGVRQIGESGVVGAILGAVHASRKNGLDMKASPTSPTLIPLDGVGIALGLVAGVFAADEPHGVGKTLINGASACSAVFMFRQTNDLMTKLQIKKSGITPGGGAALPNAGPASMQPGVISKATFQGDPRGHRGAMGHGFHRSTAVHGEDPVVNAIRGM